MNTPFKDIPEEGKKAILYGCSEPIQVAYISCGKARVYEFNFDGVIPTIERRYKETTSDSAKEEIHMDYMTSVPCPTCHGQRLKPESPCCYIRWEKYITGNRNVYKGYSKVL